MIRNTPKEPYKGLKRTPMKRKPRKIAFLTKTPPKKRKGLQIRIDPLDALFSQYVRLRDNYTCQRCGVKSKNVQCAHFIGRRNKNTRFNESNATTLCMGCHQYFHANPNIFVEWTKKRLSARELNLLLAQERIIFKPDKKAIELYLKIKIIELGG
jgi:5-methylcytosine-specific restriction endonuclease McrA